LTNLKNASSSLASNPKAWAFELTNSTFTPPAYFPGVMLVDVRKPGTDAWAIQYRSIDPAAIPAGLGGWDNTSVAYVTNPYNVYTHPSDNVNVLYLAYQTCLDKGFALSFEYQNFKIKNQNVTNLKSKNLDQTYMVKMEFFY
jgi:hypothetical protein